MEMTQTSDTAHRTTTGHALRFTAPANRVAFAWRTDAGWQVYARDSALRDRICAALERRVVAARTHTEPDGDRVLDGWEEVDPADARYPTLFMLQLSRLGLGDLAVDLLPRNEADTVMAARSLG
jgi:hypothetical protein